MEFDPVAAQVIRGGVDAGRSRLYADRTIAFEFARGDGWNIGIIRAAKWKTGFGIVEVDTGSEWIAYNGELIYRFLVLPK